MYKQFFVFVFLFSVLVSAHPSWVQQGVTATYDGYSGVKSATGGYTSPVQMVIVARVDSVQNGQITVTTTFTEALYGLSQPPMTATYSPTDVMGGFWIDDQTLRSAKQGDQIKGKLGTFTVKERETVSSTTLVKLERTEGDSRVTLIYDEKTGLLASQTEIFPPRETYMFFKSIQPDISNYIPAATAPIGTPTGIPQPTPAQPGQQAVEQPQGGQQQQQTQDGDIYNVKFSVPETCASSLALIGLIAFAYCTQKIKKRE